MSIAFLPATREQLFARICLYGAGGSGKTYTMLTMLAVLAEHERIRRGDTGPARFAVIDTEKGRSRKYLGVNGWGWQRFEPTSFNPATLTEALAVAGQAGFHAVGVDSGSHFWDGRDGMQEQVDRISAASNSRNSFSTGWKDMNPVEREMWDAVTGCPMHLVMTLRTKTEYVMQESEKNGRTVTEPKRIGLKPRQRDGFEYEMDLVISMDLEHNGTVEKSDLPVVPVGSVWPKPGPDLPKLIAEFCEQGVEAPGPLLYRARALDPGLTLAASKELFDEVEAAGHGRTPVFNEHDQVVPLAQLIRSRASAIKTADDAAAREAARAASAAKVEQQFHRVVGQQVRELEKTIGADA